jgi:hypothetical protein
MAPSFGVAEEGILDGRPPRRLGPAVIAGRSATNATSPSNDFPPTIAAPSAPILRERLEVLSKPAQSDLVEPQRRFKRSAREVAFQ